MLPRILSYTWSGCHVQHILIAVVTEGPCQTWLHELAGSLMKPSPCTVSSGNRIINVEVTGKLKSDGAGPTPPTYTRELNTPNTNW
ncbi:hypothetical protein VNO80_02315 [Phaseolus coccineus]|uniref:Uncharacterized protein n=1 Tax=Phaseolus coccineus TaxID=3886 RepID=A0AAN9RLD8_PHACN